MNRMAGQRCPWRNTLLQRTSAVRPRIPRSISNAGTITAPPDLHMLQISSHAKDRTHSDATREVVFHHPVIRDWQWPTHPPGRAVLAHALKINLDKPRQCSAASLYHPKQTKHERKSKPVLLPVVAVGEGGERRTGGGRDVPGSCRTGSVGGAPSPPRTGRPQPAEFTSFKYYLLTLRLIPSIHRVNFLSFFLCVYLPVPCRSVTMSTGIITACVIIFAHPKIYMHAPRPILIPTQPPPPPNQTWGVATFFLLLTRYRWLEKSNDALPKCCWRCCLPSALPLLFNQHTRPAPAVPHLWRGAADTKPGTREASGAGAGERT